MFLVTSLTSHNFNYRFLFIKRNVNQFCKDHFLTLNNKLNYYKKLFINLKNVKHKNMLSHDMMCIK